MQTQTGIRKVIEIKFETNLYETGQIKAAQLCLDRIRAVFCSGKCFSESSKSIIVL